MSCQYSVMGCPVLFLAAYSTVYSTMCIKKGNEYTNASMFPILSYNDKSHSPINEKMPTDLIISRKS